MKIEIDEKSYEFLKNLIDEIDQQNNRMTASPYFYVIQEKRRRSVPDCCGDDVIYIRDGNEYTADELLKEMSEEELENAINNYDIQVYDVVEEFNTPENHNVFFTEKACHKHIEQNHYHWNSPRSYVRHAWRNPEISELFEVIRKIVKGK